MRRGLCVVSIGWLLFLLEPLSSTGLSFPFFALTFWITVLLGVSLALGRTPPGPVRRARLLAWALYPLAAAALLALFVSSQSAANPLFRLRFGLSRPALEAAAQAALSGQPAATSVWVGLFPVHRIDVWPGEVWLLSDGCGVFDQCGLAYVPGPVPRGRSKTRLQHLDGPWHHLYAVF